MKVAIPLWGVLCVAVWLALMGCGDHEDLIITTESLPNGRVGEEYFFGIEVEGDADEFRVAAGTLPPGIQLIDSGILLGTPTLAGTYTFTIEVFDLSDGLLLNRTSQGFSLLIEP
jgi:hypothetical protein